MGVRRSLVNLHQTYTKSTPNPPTLHISTLKKWSTRYHWQARVTQQTENDNAITLEQIENEKAKILEQYRERHMNEAEALALLADQARGNMADFAGVQTQSDLAEHSRAALVKNITHHYTQTNQGAHEDEQIELRTTRFVLGLYDAQKALELILKHHGAFAADNKTELISQIEVVYGDRNGNGQPEATTPKTD